MLRLAFLILVFLGALALLIAGFVGMGLYQAVRLQEPAAEPPPTNSFSAAASGPVTMPVVSRTPVTSGTTRPSTVPEQGRPAVPPKAAPPPPVAVAVAPVVLSAADAILHGDGLRLDRGAVPTVTDWSNRTDTLEWTMNVPAGGLYQVDIQYACDRTDGGGVYSLRSGTGSVTASVRPTAGWEDYQSQYAGQLYLSQGASGLLLRPVYMLPGGKLMNLRSVTLTFVKQIEPPALRPGFRRRREF